MTISLGDWQIPLWSAAGAFLALVVALLIHFSLFRLAHRLNLKKQTVLAQAFLHCEKPVRLILLLVMEIAVLSFLPISESLKGTIRHALGICLIVATAWLLIAMVDVVEAVLGYRYSSEVADDLAVRRVRTQVQVLRRIIVMMIVVVTIAGVLMTFPSIRHIGESLFASAGLAAVVAGLAARTMLSNLLAGVQIALTEPIRLEDVVIVEGEWGWIEEITTTFVVVRIWDLRRLVLPISYFIESPSRTGRVRVLICSARFSYTSITPRPWTRSGRNCIACYRQQICGMASHGDFRSPMLRIEPSNCGL